MIAVGVCDDEATVRKQLIKIIDDFCESHSETFEVFEYSSGKELIDSIDKLDAVFLDVEMPEMNGLETAALIRKNNSNIKIIISTGHIDYFKDSVKVGIFRYVTKPFEVEEVNEALISLVLLLGEGELLPINSNGRKLNLKQKDIISITTYKGEISYITKENEFKERKSLLLVKDSLNESFVQISRECIINMRYLTDFTKNFVELDGRIKYEISRRRRQSLEDNYYEFERKYL